MTTARFLRANLAPCAGLIAPLLLWALATQLGEVLPDAECGGRLWPLLWVSLLCVVLALASAYVSWRTGRRLAAESVYPVAHGFVRALGAGFALIFAYALALQALASALLTGCER